MAVSFKVGDRVKINESCHRNEEGVITNINGSTIAVRVDGSTDPSSHSGHESYLELIKSQNIMSNLTEKFALAFKKEPEKSFRKAGITNGDDLLTEDGVKVFLGWLLQQNGEKFKTEVVDGILAEMEKE